MPIRILRFLSATVCCVLFLLTGTDVSADPPEIRVLLISTQKPLLLTIEGRYLISDSISGKSLAVSRGLNGVQIKPHESNGILLAGVPFPSQISIKSPDDNRIILNGREYRGLIKVVREDSGNLSYVNFVPLEAYLYSVVTKEVGDWWPYEALKAQAVAARTYAMYQMRTRKQRGFDVYSSQFSQVYGGSSHENQRAVKAADLTRGLVLVYEKSIFPTFYHATCGGMTRPASDLWNISIPPLAGGVECGFCWFSPHYNWTLRIDRPMLKDRFLGNNQNLSADTPIAVTSLTAEGRVSELSVFTDDNIRHPITGKNFRAQIGPETVRSERFNIAVEESSVVLEGQGWGHGVGMCQWGALGMSIMRKKFSEILTFYYPHSQIAKAYE